MVSEKDIDSLVLESEILCQTRLGRITVVTMVLPSGFVITETSSSASTENYNYQYGIENCIKKIKDKLWELEVYREKHNDYQLKKGFVTLECENSDSQETTMEYKGE